MATRITPTARDADNNAGTVCSAAPNDWRSADADSMSARDTTIPPQMPDIRLQATTRSAINSDCLSYLREESIYVVRGLAAPSVDNDVIIGSTDNGLDAAYKPADIDRFRRSPEYNPVRTRFSRHRNFVDLRKTSTSKELRQGTQI